MTGPVPVGHVAVHAISTWAGARPDADSLEDAGGLPVLLVGGMASTPQTLLPLHDWLLRRNARPAIAPIRFGIDCGERTAGRVAVALEGLVQATGRPAVIVAHSRGGHFARAVAVRRPDLVAGLMTLGSPVNRMLGIHPVLRAEAVVLGLFGSLGVPGLMRVACLYGECCRRLRADLFAPFPPAVPFLSIYSRVDRLVDWRSCVTPEARHREVATTHAGLVSAPVALAAVGEELERLLGPTASPALALAAS